MLGHKVSSAGLEVDKAKIDVISKLPPPTNIKGVRSFLGHAGFYRRFITNFSKIARPLTKLLEKDTPFEFDDECQKAFELLKEKLTCAPVIVSPNWNLSFELMCDASDFVVGAILDVDLRVRALLCIERDRVDSLRHHMALSQEEFCQIRRDRDDARRRLRRLESFVERRLGFRPYQNDNDDNNGVIKCQLLNFKGTEGVVGLTRWFEKMETVFHISNCPEVYQVKYATCTLLDSALTWWNSHKRTIGVDAAFAMTWRDLMKLMTEVYCPRNEIQKMETELWNLTVKNNDLAAYT
ncbi:reverse transcriptase domain-containing protein [Tanacetum coccineum]|uniref:Reverse transcriptase domain-containing protein n=1 Tax=Tanacetum coccineum TaxID=301880 RepID=A0ABQ5C2I9_9ASTR